MFGHVCVRESVCVYVCLYALSIAARQTKKLDDGTAENEMVKGGGVVVCVCVCVCVCAYVCMCVCVYGWVGRWMGGWVSGWVGGRVGVLDFQSSDLMHSYVT